MALLRSVIGRSTIIRNKARVRASRNFPVLNTEIQSTKHELQRAHRVSMSAAGISES